jgi:hypothetical protein
MTLNAVPIVIGLVMTALSDAPRVSAPVRAALILDEGSVPLGADGRPRSAALPGARARQPLPDDVVRRLRELSEQRGAVGGVSPAGAAAAPAAPLPGDGDAPARFDSGDRDPDRLRAAPPPPRNR